MQKNKTERGKKNHIKKQSFSLFLLKEDRLKEGGRY
jgi:hypothetical protein